MKVNFYSYNTSTQNDLKKNKNIYFGKAWVNILSMADNHGKITTLPSVFETIKMNFNKIFPNANSINTLNIFAHVGDMMINSSKKGFVSKPKQSAGSIQFGVFQKFVLSLHNLFDSDSGSHHCTLVSTYTPGNHCFEGGSTWLLGKLKNAAFRTIITNADFPDSKKISTHRIYSVQDDTIPNKHHKILMLGLTVPNLDFHIPKHLTKNISVLDSCNKSDSKLCENDLPQTYERLQNIIKKFKKSNPNGAVILKSHTGEKISSNIAQKIPGIDLILNAHDHTNNQFMVNNVPIISHGKDNQFFNSIKMFFDDNGVLSINEIERFYSKNTVVSQDNPIGKLLQKTLKQDLEPLLKIKAADRKITELTTDGIRYEHNLLANYVTDTVYEKLNKTFPNLNAAGIISSTFRGRLQHGANNLDIMRVLDGSIESLSEMFYTKIEGDDLIKILTQNVKANIENPDRNTIIQWSGIIIDKNKLAKGVVENSQIQINKSFKIKCKTAEGKENYQSINPEQIYQIALPSKFVEKYCPEELKDKFVKTGKTLNEIFIQTLRENNYEVKVEKETQRKRIFG